VQGEGGAAGGGDLARYRGDLVFGAGGEGDGGALTSKKTGGRRADAASGAGHERHAARVYPIPHGLHDNRRAGSGGGEIELLPNSKRSPHLSDIPLFPLNVVLMPGAPLPLHIFEDRYKQMVNECLEQESEFGMVFADESGTRDVGCTARIVELVERYEDGRMLILVEGSRRFRLNNVLTGKPYYIGEIDFFEEEAEEDANALAEECIALLERVVEAATEGSVGIEIEPPYRNLSFAIAGRVEFEPDTRQQILELTSERERLEKVKELLTAAAERLERERQAREKAQTNGHLRADWRPGS
jgi:Lon protease-like protein